MDKLKNILGIGLQEEKRTVLKGIISELESLKSLTMPQEFTSDFSSDRCVATTIPEIIESVNRNKSTLKTVIVVGSGPLWNIPKEVGVDLVLSLDVNPNQLHRNQERMLEILSANKVEDLLPKPKTEINKNDVYAVINERERMRAPNIERDSYLSYHYLFSEEKLHQTQDFLRKGIIAFVRGDLSNHDFTKVLGGILNKHQSSIVFLDFSNVMEWVAGGSGHVDEEAKNNFLQSLNNLPIDENCAILHSHSIGRVGRSPIEAQLSIGLTDYGQVTKKVT